MRLPDVLEKSGDFGGEGGGVKSNGIYSDAVFDLGGAYPPEALYGLRMWPICLKRLPN